MLAGGSGFEVAVVYRIGFGSALLVAVTVALCGSAPAENDRLIVPWRRIGPVELGMSRADLVRVLGEPTHTMGGPPDGVSIYNWRDDLSITIKTDGSYVTQICALSPAYATAEGVRPGLADVSVTALLGQPESSRVYTRWWRLSYTNLFWPGLMISIPLTGFAANHTVRAVCVNRSA